MEDNRRQGQEKKVERGGGGNAKKIAYTTSHTTPFTPLDRLYLIFPLTPYLTLTLPYVQSFHLANSAQCRMTCDGLKEGEDERGGSARTRDKGNQKQQTKYVRGGDGFFGTSTLEFWCQIWFLRLYINQGKFKKWIWHSKFVNNFECHTVIIWIVLLIQSFVTLGIYDLRHNGWGRT